jgi:peptidyl-prolyl cis-trans isomerase D
MPSAVANRAVFSAAPPTADKPSYGKVALEDGRYALFAVTKVTPGNPAEVPEQQQAMLKQQLSQIDGAAAAKAYVDGMRKRFKVQVQESQL